MARDLQLYEKQQQYMATTAGTLPYSSPASRQKMYGSGDYVTAAYSNEMLQQPPQPHQQHSPLVAPDGNASLYGQLRPQRLPCGCATYVTRSEIGGYRTATIAHKDPADVAGFRSAVQSPASATTATTATDYYKFSTFTGGTKAIGSRRESEPTNGCKNAATASTGCLSDAERIVLQTDDLKITMRTVDSVTSPASVTGDFLTVARQPSTTSSGEGKVTVNLCDKYSSSKQMADRKMNNL